MPCQARNAGEPVRPGSCRRLKTPLPFARSSRGPIPSFSAWRDVITEYRLGDLVGVITCPVLALIGDREGNEPLSQFDAFVGALPGQVSTRRFNGDDGAATHCQSDNIRLLAQVVFDWLDERLA